MKNLIVKASDVLTLIEISMEKARVVSEDLSQEFFETNPNEPDGLKALSYYFCKARIQNEIISDYNHEALLQIKVLKESINKLCEMMKKGVFSI